jgi:hypothetical protein
MEILLLYFRYIFSLLMYVFNKKHLYTKILQVYNYDTRSANNFHLPITNLTKYQKGAYYTRIKIFNCLPNYIKDLANEIQVLKRTLKRFLLNNSFYSTDEYFNTNK